MARVDGPLLSIAASGSVAGVMTFSRWKGRPYVRELVTPANPKSVKQISVRGMMKFLSQNWAALGTTPKASWDDLAEAGSTSPFNQYTKKNLERWRNFLAPTQAYPAAESDTAAVLGTLTATGGVRQITLSQAITTANQNWSLLIFRSTTTGFTPSFSNLIATVLGEGAGPITYVDTPLDAGTYFYVAIGGSAEGVKGSASAEATATAT